MGTNDNVVVPDFIDGLPVTSIGDDAFQQNSLTHIKLPQNLTFIGSRAFASCYDLAEVSIPNSVKEIYSHVVDLALLVLVGGKQLRLIRLALNKVIFIIPLVTE